MKRAAICMVALVVLAGAYALLLCFPGRLFPYQEQYGTVILRSPQPLPPQAAALAMDVQRRIERSALYDPGLVHHVYLCDKPWLFALFANHKYRAGGVAYVLFNGNIFIRPANIERDRLVGPSGLEVEGERTLTYFVAHEVAHHLTAAYLGWWSYAHLARWQEDGYADYVAKAGAFDLLRERQRLRAGAVELDPERSGLYLRYHLVVAVLLDIRHVRVDAMLKDTRDIAEIGLDD